MVRTSVVRRRGQALFEFAIIALILAVMLGGMLSLGHMFFAAHTIQQAVDVAAQEIARTPFPAASELGLGSFDDEPDSVMATALFREQIFDEQFLVIDPDNPESPAHWDGTGTYSLTDASKKLPLLNRLLISCFIFDPTFDPQSLEVPPEIPNRFAGVYRYPGAIVEYEDPIDSESRYTVLVPLLEHSKLPHPPLNPDHIDITEQIVRWVKPVEEMVSDNGAGPFSVAANDPDNDSFQPGTVALRINYPFQAAGLVRYVPTGRTVGDNVTEVDRVRANNDFLANPPFSREDLLIPDSSNPNSQKYHLVVDRDVHSSFVFGGRYGLGSTGSYRQRIHSPTKTPTPPNSTDPREYNWDIEAYGVRPYRRVITAQAIYRREVFE